MRPKRYAEAKAAGVCPRCWTPVEQGKIYCPVCAEMESMRQHINYIRRKYGVSHEEAVRIADEEIVDRKPERKPIPKKRPPKPKQSVTEIDGLAKAASEQEQKYVSYGEVVARQSGAYDWKIRRGK